jgi:diguanylate cyclase (GGDEF)-like protein/PAS domain S-box-containing protein
MMSGLPNGLLPAMLNAADDAIFAKALDGTILSWNLGAQHTFGYSAEEIIGRSVSVLFPPGRRNELDEILQTVRKGAHIRQRETVRVHKDGHTVSISLTVSPIRDQGGTIVGASVVSRQISRRPPDPSPDEEEDRLQTIVEQMPVILWTADSDLRITSNWGAGTAAGLRSGAAVGETVREYFHCRDSEDTPVAQHQAALQGLCSRYEHELDGRVFDVSLGPLRGPGGKIVGCIGVGLDITERKKSEDQMRYLATHDSLTGLANHRQFVTSLEAEVRRSRRTERAFSLLLLDLDGFKSINDMHGHLVGDRALVRVAGVLRQHCRSTDLAARYGGDEFALLLIESNAAMVKEAITRIEAFLAEDEEKPPLAVSIGCATFPDDGLAPRALIHAADARLYQNKAKRGARLATAP